MGSVKEKLGYKKTVVSKVIRTTHQIGFTDTAHVSTIIHLLNEMPLDCVLDEYWSDGDKIFAKFKSETKAEDNENG